MMLDIKNLNSFYGKSHALWDITFSAKKGKITALVGRNGMGKTTTLRCIMGLIDEKSGEIVAEGKRLEHLKPYEIAKTGIGYVPDNLGIFPTLTVEENILLAAHLSKRKGDWDIDRVYSLFEKLYQIRKSKAGNLSGGEKKMLSIGRALASNPKLILIDEPTEGLAPLIIQGLSEAMNKIKQLGVTILMTDQNIGFVRSVSDYVYIIEQGKIVYEGTIDAVKQDRELIIKYIAV